MLLALTLPGSRLKPRQSSRSPPTAPAPGGGGGAGRGGVRLRGRGLVRAWAGRGGAWAELRRRQGRSPARPRGGASARVRLLTGGAAAKNLGKPSRSWSRALFWWLLPTPSGVWVHPSLPSSLLPSIPCIWACIPFPDRFVLDPVLTSPQTTGQRPCLVPCSPSLPPASSSR